MKHKVRTGRRREERLRGPADAAHGAREPDGRAHDGGDADAAPGRPPNTRPAGGRLGLVLRWCGGEKGEDGLIRYSNVWGRKVGGR